MFTKIFNLTNLTLLVALSLSAIAAYYSIAGLIAIFSAAVIPIIVMGGILELSKVVTTVWLHKYWDRVKWSMKFYLVTSVIALAFLTSMGIFGFLSKAHSDQSLVTGDVQSKIAIYDEKIRIAKENIDANRAALKQLDAAVDQIMGRSTTEQGAERSVQIRRQQGPERQRLIREIEAEQKKISSLNEERAPIAAEVRKVEAEVGPIKYIAALIYGDNPDSNLLERAVRWVIILIVLVFDPLALTLVLAANSSRRWDKIKPVEKQELVIEPPVESKVEDVVEANNPIEEPVEQLVEEPKERVEQVYLKKPWIDKVPGIDKVGHQVYKPEVKTIEVEQINCNICSSPLEKIGKLGLFCSNVNCDSYKETIYTEKPDVSTDIPEVVIETENVTEPLPYKETDGGYITYGDKSMSRSAALSLYPEMFRLTADSTSQISTNFGTKFPKYASKGDMFVRVDILPNRVFKYDGTKWIEIIKQNSDSYLHDRKYIEYLVNEIDAGRYDVELLTDSEKQLIEEFLKKSK
jgi:hypothetical protein